MTYIGHLPEIGAGKQEGRATTDTLYVCPNGNSSNGKTWASAYTTIQAALTAASTDADDCTLIMISPHDTYYDIDTTGDPTFTGNYILAGTHRTWAKIKNDHVSATSVLKFSGKVELTRVDIDLGTDNNGVIMTGPFRLRHCQLTGADLTEAKIGLLLEGASAITGKLVDVHFIGEGGDPPEDFTGMKLIKVARSYFEDIQMHECATCIQITDAASVRNEFRHLDLGDSFIALDIDAGSEQYFDDVHFHHNGTNVDDEVGDHLWSNIRGEFEIYITPDDFTGVAIPTHVDPDTFGGDTEIIAAAAIDAPFRIVAVHVEGDSTEKFRVRFSADSGVTHYDDIMIEGDANKTKREGYGAPSGSGFIFNTDTRISASSKSETGDDDASVWLEIQQI